MGILVAVSDLGCIFLYPNPWIGTTCKTSRDNKDHKDNKTNGVRRKLTCLWIQIIILLENNHVLYILKHALCIGILYS